MKSLRSDKIFIVAVVVVLLASCTVSAPPTVTPTVQDGVITGELGFPSDQIPPLRVAAIDVDSGDSHTIDTELNQTTYSLSVPPGSYHVIAYLIEEDSDFAGGYTEFVTCGLRADCPSHELILVSVETGETIDGVDPTDWYAPPGSFPPRSDAGDGDA